MLVKAAGGFGKNIKPHRLSTALNDEEGKSIVSAPPSPNCTIFCSSREAALSLPIDNISGDISVAKTRPLPPTLFAPVKAVSHIPVVISRTLSLGLTCASSANLLLTFWVPFSKVLHHFYHPSDILIPTLTLVFFKIDWSDCIFIECKNWMKYIITSSTSL
jgi:hypothetical protein